jgi:hypothetical protein
LSKGPEKNPVRRKASRRSRSVDDSNDDEKAPRIESPGQVWASTIIEQIEVPGAGYKFAIHEQMPDGCWRTREASEFPDPSGKGIYVPMKQPIWSLPEVPLDHESESALLKEIIEFIRHHAEVRDEFVYIIMACWVLLTWRFEEFRVVAYLNFLGPKGTGKTRFLEILESLCYRGRLVTSPSPASVFWVVDRYRLTLLADNYEYWPKETRRELDGLFNAGYRRGALVLRRPREAESNVDLDVYKVYSPKALSGTRVPGPALESRCITIRTTQARRPMPMRVDETWARRLRSKLLQYRFRHLEKPAPEDDDVLNKYGRVGELFQGLLTVAPDNETQMKIAECAIGVFQDQVEEEATGEEAEVIQAIVACNEGIDGGRLGVQAITKQLNQTREENDQIRPETVGWILKRLGFKKARLSKPKGARAIIVEKDLLERLMEVYDVSPVQPTVARASGEAVT